MLAAYGVDVLAPGLSLRRMWVLLKRLPPHARAINKDAEGQWSQESYLLAAIFDAVQNLTYVTQQIYSKSRLKPPKPLERPGDNDDHDVVTKTPSQGPVSGWRRLLRSLQGGVKPDAW